MLKTRLLLLAGLTLTGVVAQPAVAEDSLHVAHSVFQAEKNNQKHPLTLTRTITINQDVATPRLCIGYDASHKRTKGWSVADIQIDRVDGTQETYRLAEQVRKGSFVKCTKADQVADLVVGDMAVFEFKFENMLRLKRNGDDVDRANVNAVIVADGFPLYLGTVGVTPGEEEDGKKGGWLYSANYNFQAGKNNQKHPQTFTKMIVMPRDVEAPLVCPAYRHTLGKANKGKVSVTANVYRGDEISETLDFSGKIRKNAFKRCKNAQDMLVGDVVEFDFTFSGIPRLKKNSTKTDYAEASGVVSANGAPEFVTATDPKEPAPPPTPDTPPPSGGLSAADIAAASKLLVASKPSQLWRFKGDNPTKWTVVGPKTRLGDGRGSLNEATAGYGNNIATAVADYERKMGKLASGGSLTRADIDGLVWYSKINSSQGPTSIRRSRTGGYYGEYYRPSRGAIHDGPYPSPAKAFEWLRRQGL